MKAKELKNIKLAPLEKRKRVLLVNPKKEDYHETHTVPNYGLALLAAILKKRGHSVLVVDYVFMHKDIDISVFINDFKPHIIGISAFTINARVVDNLVSKINQIDPNIPIMIGGPHATFYSDVLQKNNNLDYIIVGEGELIVNEIVENAKKEKVSKIMQSQELADLDDIPYPDYESFYLKENLREYPIMTSRGCPFQCSFCAVGKLGYRRWRARSPEKCIIELKAASMKIPNFRPMAMDDSPTTDKERFKKFLRLYLQEFKAPLYVANLRADSLDEETIILLKKTGCEAICLGLESAHPEVFKIMNKGETLEQIEEASKLIKKHKIKLGFSFVIGLPGESLKTITANIRFVNRLKADILIWNLVIPYKGTAVRKWFDEHGTVYNEFDQSCMTFSDLKCPEPFCESPDFTKEERKKAFYMCLFRTNTYEVNFHNLSTAIKAARKYGLLADFLGWLPHAIVKNAQNKKTAVKKLAYFYKKEGMSYLLKKVLFNLEKQWK